MQCFVMKRRKKKNTHKINANTLILWRVRMNAVINSLLRICFSRIWALSCISHKHYMFCFVFFFFVKGRQEKSAYSHLFDIYFFSAPHLQISKD